MAGSQEVAVLGRHRRAGLAVRLAHQLHSFLEEKSRFEELKSELLLQEKLWAVEASNLERDLGSFGISNASHGLSAELHEGVRDAVVWRSRKGRETGCSCADCWGTSIRHGSCVPCRSAMAQTGELLRKIGESTPCEDPSAHSASAGQLVASAMGSEPAIPEDFRDFRQHLTLLLAARASVMAAEASVERLKEAEASAQTLDLPPEIPETQMTQMTQQLPQNKEPHLAIRSAGLKQLLTLRPVPSVKKSHGAGDGETLQRKEAVGVADENDAKGNSSISNGKFQDHLSKLNGILSVPAESAEVDVPEPEVPALGAWDGGEAEMSEEITQEFANTFLQLAEERALEASETGDGKGEATDGSDGPVTVAEVKPVPQSETVEAPQPDAEAQQVDSTDSIRHSQASAASLQSAIDPAVQLRTQSTQVTAEAFADRSAARRQKVLQWTKAAEFLRGETEGSKSQAQLAELLLEVDFARRKMQELQKHREIKRRLSSGMDGTKFSAGWLNCRVESAKEVLRLALQPPWEKQEQLEKMQKVQRLLQSSRRGKSQIFSLTACVEAVVAAYDIERCLLLAACEKPDEVLESEDEGALRRKRGDLALQALEREVAKALRSISECRRLLLDLFDKGAIETKEKQPSHRPSSSNLEPKVDERRRSEWAKVYADLLQIEAKDSTTITIKTSRGVAWAKT